MSNLKEIKGMSNSRRNNVFNYEISNIKELYSICKKRVDYKEIENEDEEIKEFKFSNFYTYFIKEKGKEENFQNNNIFITKWDFLNETNPKKWELSSDNKFKIETGMWVSTIGENIDYTIVLENEVIAKVKLNKENEEIVVSYYAKNEDVERQILENSTKECTAMQLLSSINYNNSEIEEVVDLFKSVFLSEKVELVEQKILKQENEELQQKVIELNKKIEEITNRITEISIEATKADNETKKTIEEMHEISKETLKVKKENESLKTNIFNIRKFITKKCAFVPFLGRIIIKEINKELGSQALPSGE